jgi:hypothetical protein
MGQLFGTGSQSMGGQGMSTFASGSGATPIPSPSPSGGGIGAMMPFVKMAGAGLAAFGDVQQADTANAVGMYEQGVARTKAKEIEAKTAFDQKRQAEEGSRTISSLEVAQGSSGSGNLLAIAKQESELQLQNLMIGREGAVAAKAARAEGAMARWQGKQAQKQGYMKAVGTLLSGF